MTLVYSEPGEPGEAIPSPEVVVVPQTNVDTTASGFEMKVPFQIDPATGGVAVVSSYGDIIQQHVLSIVMTEVSERVMLPRYGTTLQSSVFDQIHESVLALLQQSIQTAIQDFEPAVTVSGVRVQQNPFVPSAVDVLITYSLVPTQDLNTVSVTVGGGITQVSSQ